MPSLLPISLPPFTSTKHITHTHIKNPPPKQKTIEERFITYYILSSSPPSPIDLSLHALPPTNHCTTNDSQTTKKRGKKNALPLSLSTQKLFTSSISPLPQHTQKKALQDLQSEQTTSNGHGHHKHARGLESRSRILSRVFRSLLAVVGLAAGVAAGLILDVVGLALAEDFSLDDLLVVELVELVARELSRGLGVERTLDVLEGGEGGPGGDVSFVCSFFIHRKDAI